MPNCPDSSQSLYGEPNRSDYWVLSLIAGKSGRRPLILLLRDQVVFCFLRSGAAWLENGSDAAAGVGPGELVMGDTGKSGATLRRNGATDGMIVGFRRQTLRQSLLPHQADLAPSLRNLLFGEGGPIAKEPVPEWIPGRWTEEFRRPPVKGTAATFWHESKVREFIAIGCFSSNQALEKEFFCTRQKRLASERVERTRAWLETHLDEPFDLGALAEAVGCSAHYLSRTFSEATGTTISQYLRRIRIERASALLSTGRFNVGEAAIEVGYQSLSHFSKAFLKEKGCLPSRFAAAGV